MKHEAHIKEFIDAEVKPLLKIKKANNVIKENKEIVVRLQELLPYLKTEVQVKSWLRLQRKKYCLEKPHKQITSENHVKVTKTNKTVVNKRIVKTKPLIEINPTGDDLIIENERIEEGKTETEYSKIDIVFQSEICRTAESNLKNSINSISNAFNKVEKRHEQDIRQSYKDIKKLEIESVKSIQSIEASLEIKRKLLNEASQKLKRQIEENEVVDMKDIKNHHELTKDLLTSQKELSRLKTGALYHRANTVYPMTEKMMKEMKDLQEMSIKAYMTYSTLVKVDADIVETHLKANNGKVKIAEEDISEEDIKETAQGVQELLNTLQGYKEG